MRRVILDTGPLVACLCPRDEHHAWVRQTFQQIAPGSLVCEAVLAETCHRAAKEAIAPDRVIEFIRRLRLQPVSLANELAALTDLLARYADTPMDFADACVLRLAEIHPDTTVCTTDSHFNFFRKNARESIPLLAPFVS
jgi:predicted nucleic acid-binding protein